MKSTPVSTGQLKCGYAMQYAVLKGNQSALVAKTKCQQTANAFLADVDAKKKKKSEMIVLC